MSRIIGKVEKIQLFDWITVSNQLSEHAQFTRK